MTSSLTPDSLRAAAPLPALTEVINQTTTKTYDQDFLFWSFATYSKFFAISGSNAQLFFFFPRAAAFNNPVVWQFQTFNYAAGSPVELPSMNNYYLENL